MSTFETDQNDRSALLPSKNGSRTGWTTFQCAIFVIIAIIITGLATNMDRIFNELSSDSSNNDNFDGTYDIIVVGGGPSGLTQAHFLQKQYPSYKILLIEQLNRTGGRQFSSTLSYRSEDNSITFEHGAMRTTPSLLYTLRLLNYLNLCDDIIPFDVYSNSSKRLFSSRNNYLLQRNVDANYYINNYGLTPSEQALLLSTPSGSPFEAIFTTLIFQVMLENGQTELPSTPEGTLFYVV